MQDIDTHQQAGIFYLTITTFCSSLAAFIISSATKTNVAWWVGIIAGIVSIYCGYLTQKEKKLNIRKAQKEIELMERDKPIK